MRRYLNAYLITPSAGHQAALDGTKALVFNDQNFVATWTRLTPTDRAILAMMANGVEDLHGGAARTRLGRVLGLDKQVPLSTPQNALRRLMAANIVVRMDTGTYRFEDEAFAAWVKAREMEAPVALPQPVVSTKSPRKRKG